MNKKSKQEFLSLYEKAHEPLMRFCIAKSYGIMEAEDLANETLLVALENFHKLRNKQAFLSYLFSTANNICTTQLRRKKFKGVYQEEKAFAMEDTGVSIESKYDANVLYETMSELPESQKEALILFEISGFSIKEIMEIQGAGESAVKQRIKRGRERLATLFLGENLKRTAVLAAVVGTKDMLAGSAVQLQPYFEAAKVAQLPISKAAAVATVSGYSAGFLPSLGGLLGKASIVQKVAIAGLAVTTTTAVVQLNSEVEEPAPISVEEVKPTKTEPVISVVQPVEDITEEPETIFEDVQVYKKVKGQYVKIDPISPKIVQAGPVELAIPQVMPVKEDTEKLEVPPIPDPIEMESSGKLKPVKGNGEVTKKEVAIKDFNRLGIEGVFDVVLIQGSKAKLEVETDDNLHEYITAKNEGEALILGLKEGTQIRKSKKMVLYVTIVELKKLHMEGVGDISCENSLKADDLEFEIAGVGDTHLKLDCKNVEGNLTMVGDVLISGKVDNAILNNSGVGDLMADNLKAKKLTLNNAGIGDVSVYAEEKYNINNTGIGDVKYKGEAEAEVSNSGLGKIKRK